MLRRHGADGVKADSTSTAHPADLDLSAAATALAQGVLTSVELVEACLQRIARDDGTPSHDGDPESINAWIRTYPDDALTDALRADERRRPDSVERLGAPPTLCGVPIGLQDLFAVKGKPLTASSRVPTAQPESDSALWARLRAAGMVLLGHLHTHEFGSGLTTDQVGNPWDLDRSAGGSAGGPAAALAARMVPAAVASDTFGSLRIPAALCGVSGFKPTRGAFPLEGMVPLCPQLDHAGPMARTVADCALLFQAMSGRELVSPLRPLPLSGLRIGQSPRAPIELDPDVGEAFESAVERCARLGAEMISVRAPVSFDALDDYLNLFGRDVLEYHRQYERFRDLYRPALRTLLEQSERSPIRGRDLDAALTRRAETVGAWMEWFATQDVLALIEPTVATVAPLRGAGYQQFGTQLPLGRLAYYWNWVGFPVVSFPAGVGRLTGLPVGVSLIGPRGTDFDLLRAAMTLQSALGVPDLADET